MKQQYKINASKEKNQINPQMWDQIPIFLALKKLRQKDNKTKARIDCTERPRMVKAKRK